MAYILVFWLIFFFKQKTAYEMRISDWSSDVCSSDLGERRDGGGACRELAPVDRPHLPLLGRLDRHRGDFGREKQHLGIAARELDDKLADIAVAPAEARRQRQRHRPGAGIDGAEEKRGEFGAGFGDQRDAVVRPHARGDQPVSGGQRVGLELAIGIGAHAFPARIVEIEPARSEEHTSALQSLMRISYAVFCLKKKNNTK